MNSSQNALSNHTLEIEGTVVRLVFAPMGNTEVINIVKDILKGAYLRSQNV